MGNKRSRLKWLGKSFMDQAQISEIKDLLGNVEIQSTILEKDVETSEELNKVLEDIKDYNIVVIQKSRFKSNILKTLLELNESKLRKAFFAFCTLQRRSTRKKLVLISSAEKKDHYGQIEL